MENDQFAVFRADLNTGGKDLWHKPYEQVRAEKRRVRSDCYRQICLLTLDPKDTAMDVWRKTKDRTEISDVLVLNRNGEISCYYVNEEAPRRITGFIHFNTSGAAVTMDTKDYRIEGMEGKWMAADDIIIDGRQFFLMEHQEYRRQASMVILDSYGKKIMEECKNGFDREVKQKIHEFVQTQYQDNPSFNNLRRRLEPWQKFLINGLYERSMEAGLEVKYDGIDGCVNHQKEHPGKVVPERKEKESHPEKRTSVIRKLREKQIVIARRSGKPIPKFLEQQMEREKSRR